MDTAAQTANNNITALNELGVDNLAALNEALNKLLSTLSLLENVNLTSVI
jgi:hypothetical protein